MSTKNIIISGENFYVFSEIFEEDKGIFIKFFNPEETKISTHNGKIREVEVCISKENWSDFLKNVKESKDKTQT